MARQSVEIVARQSQEFATSTTAFVPPGTPVREALAEAARSPTPDPDAPIPERREPEVPPPDAPIETHFLRAKGGNQPDVMNSIAGLPLGADATDADDTSAGLGNVAPATGRGSSTMATFPDADASARDRAFEEALERVRQSRRDIADKAAKGFSDMKAYYEAELREAKRSGASGSGVGDGAASASASRASLGEPSASSVPVSALAASVAYAAERAEAADPARRAAFAWDLDEQMLRASLSEQRAKDEEAARARSEGATESIWPAAWKGSYSPPKEGPASEAPYPLSAAWEKPPDDRAPEDPPDVRYPREAAEAAYERALAVAAPRDEDESKKPDEPSKAPSDAKEKAPPESESPSGPPGPPSPPIRKGVVAEPLGAAVKAKKFESAAAESARAAELAERRASDAERRAEALAAELKEARGKLQARDAEARELGKATAGLKQGVDEAKVELGECQRKLASANAGAAKSAAASKAALEKAAALERSNAELKASLETSKRDAIALKSKLERAEDDAARLRDRLEAARANAASEAKRAEGGRDAAATRRKGSAPRGGPDARQGRGEGGGGAAGAKEELAEAKLRCAYLEKMASTPRRAGLVEPGPAPAARPSRRGRVRGVPKRARDAPAPPTPTETSRARSRRPDRPRRPRAEAVQPRVRRRPGLPQARPDSGRDAPARRPFSAAYRNGERPVRRRRAAARFPPRASPPDDTARGDRAETPWAEEDVFGDDAEAAKARDHLITRVGPRADHLGAGMLPVAGSERREAFAAEYGAEHEGADAESHFGPGMRTYAATDEAHAEAEKARKARIEAARARRDAEAEAEAARIEAEKARAAAEKAEKASFIPPSEPAVRAAGAATPRDAENDGSVAARNAARGLGGRRRPATATATSEYSAAEAGRRGRAGSGWFGSHLEGGPPPPPPPDLRDAKAAPPPWLAPESGGKPIAVGRPAGDDAPFATADSFASWSSHVASAEARLMALSQERDALEGELARMPDGAGKTIEQRRKKADAERRLEEVLRQQSVARHQLKSANRAHLVGVGTRR